MNRVVFILLCIFLLLLNSSSFVYANDASEYIEYDFREIEKSINVGEFDMDFETVMEELASGESKGVFLQLFNGFINGLMSELIYNKEVIVRLIMLVISLALLNNLSLIFKNGQISGTGFFAIYCIIITMLLSGFMALSEMIIKTIEALVAFMYALIPAMAMAMGFTGAYTSQGGFCQLLLIGIAVMEKIIVTFIVPVVNIYVVLMLVNSLLNEDYISKLAGLLESFVKWFAKTMLAVFIGINLIQSMILPSVDAVKVKGIQRVASLTKTGGAVTDVLIGTGNVIKNAIGTTALIFIIVIIAIPIAKVLAFLVMYRVTAAVIQPISDKRVITAVESVSKGADLLYKLIIFCAVLFCVTIAVMCIATNSMG